MIAGVGSRKNSTQPTNSPFATPTLSSPRALAPGSCTFVHPQPRGGRSAGGARMHARHPSRRVMTDAQTPHRYAQTGRARLAFFAHHGRAPACDRFAQPGEHPACVRRLAFPATGRSPFGAPRGISGPGPCSPLLAAHQFLGGGAAFPPGSCAIRRTGHRYPEERVSRTSPARPLTASEDTTASLRLAETPPEAPLWSVAGRDIATATSCVK